MINRRIIHEFPVNYSSANDLILSDLPIDDLSVNTTHVIKVLHRNMTYLTPMNSHNYPTCN